MSLAVELLVQRARVGNGTLRQHDVRRLEQGRTLALAVALAPPRLWSYLVDAALDGFGDGFHRPHDGRMSTRMHQGLRVGQQALRTRVEALIERRPPDVGLMALSLEDSVLHVLCAGPMRAYLHRQGTTRRLSAREESDQGMLKLAPSWSAEQVAPGDLVFVTSVADGQAPGLDAVRAALDEGRPLAPHDVVQQLTEPAAERGIGAVAIAYRVPG